MSEEPIKPSWLKIRAPIDPRFGEIRRTTAQLGLSTVCDSSHCPNISDCWSRGHATFILLGNVCTRNCSFCAVRTGNPRGVVDAGEPERVAAAVEALGLRYVVLTTVTRDDLPDLGAGLIAATVEAVRRRNPGTRIELLIPDMQGRVDVLSTVVSSKPDVIGHNLETVKRLQGRARDPRASYFISLDLLKAVKRLDPSILTKSSLMLGMGEDRSEIIQALRDLRDAGVDLLALGQYIRPRGCSLEVVRYLEPEEFEALGEEARGMGFRYVASAPLVRSSYNAQQAFGAEG